MREHIELVYILQYRVEKATVYFLGQIIFRAILILTLWCLDNIQTFFDSRKIRISIFYMRENSELVYILQNRVEQGILYYILQIIFRAILFLALGCLDYIQIYTILLKLLFRYFTRESILSSCISSKTQQSKALYISSNRLYSEPFFITFEQIDIIQTFFDSRIIRI